MAVNYASFFIPNKSETTQSKVASALGVPTSSVNPSVNSTNQTSSGVSSTFRSGGSSGSSSSSQSSVSVQSVPSQVNTQAVYDASGGIKGINSQQSVSIGLSSANIQRRNELRNAGFSENDISVLTSANGSRYTYYNGKVVPQSNTQKAFQNQMNAQSKDTEKRFNDTAVAGGVSVLGIGLAPVSAAVGGAAGLIGYTAGGALAGLGLIDTAKGLAGLQGTGTTRKITSDKQVDVIREVENRINQQYAVDKSMNVPVFGDIPNIGLPFVGSTKNLVYGLPGSKLTSEVIQGINKKDTGLQEFENIAKQVLVEQGYNERDAVANAKFLRGVSFGGDVGSVASLFPFSGSGEYGVRTGVQKSVNLVSAFESKAAAAEAAKTAAENAATIPAIVEGVSMYVGQQRARDQEVTTEGVILSGIGSGLIGRYGAGWMAKNSILNPTKANLVYKGSWFFGQADEPFGDAYTDLMMKAVSKPTDIKVRYFVPTVTVSTSGGGSSSSNSDVVKFPKDWSGGIYSNTGSSAASGKGTSQAIIDLINGSSNSSSDSSSQTQSIAKSDSQSIGDTISNAWNNSNSYSNSFTDSSTNTYTNTNTFTEATTFSHSANLPFLPMPGGLGLGNGEAFGGGGVGVRSRRKYYDEWSAALGILQNQQPNYVLKANKIKASRERKLMQQELKRNKPRKMLQPFVPSFIKKGFL